MRIIGRLSFPIFAFMISEGARYTKNKVKYLLTMSSLALICQLVYYFFDNGSLYMCILVTFSLSLLVIFAMQEFKSAIFAKEKDIPKVCLTALLLIGTVAFVYLFNKMLDVDYGIYGIACPIFASVFDFRGIHAPALLKKADTLPTRIVAMAIPLLLLSISSGKIQYYSLLSIPLLLLYNGERGKAKMKYFFYLFYPLHLVALEAIYIIIYFLK